MIAIIDYGMGNSSSIRNMIKKANGSSIITNKYEEIKQSTAIILPGVGSFDNGMKKINEMGIIDLLNNKVLKDKTPFLGICLGMQLLFETSEEGELNGLGWLKGKVAKFDFSTLSDSKLLNIPHMGWNIVNPTNNDSIFSNLTNEARFYFVHSYHVNCKNISDVIATSKHGYDFTCSIRRDNIWGAQFHPEKSHRFGIQFFKNFLKEINYVKD